MSNNLRVGLDDVPRHVFPVIERLRGLRPAVSLAVCTALDCVCSWRAETGLVGAKYKDMKQLKNNGNTVSAAARGCGSATVRIHSGCLWQLRSRWGQRLR